jgi:prefoldin subunit 5
MAVSDNVMEVMPQEVQMSKLPYYEEIQDEFDKMKSDPNMADRMSDIGDMEFPDMSSVNLSEMRESGDSNIEISDEMMQLLQNSDVTTIVDNMKIFSADMFDQIIPDILKEVDSGIAKGINGVNTGCSEINSAISQMQEGYDGIGEGITGIKKGISQIKEAKKQLKNVREGLESFASDTLPNGMSIADLIPEDVKGNIPPETLSSLDEIKSRSQLAQQIAGMQAAFDAMQGTPAAESEAAKGLESAINQMKGIETMLNQLAEGKIPEGMSMLDMMPASVKNSLDSETKNKIAGIRSVADINQYIEEMNDAITEMRASIEEMEASQTQMASAMSQMRITAGNLEELSNKMQVLRNAVPGAFDEAEKNYMLSIEEKRDGIEKVFQHTLNEGFKDIYLLVAIASALALLLLLGYSKRKEQQRMSGQI